MKYACGAPQRRNGPELGNRINGLHSDREEQQYPLPVNVIAAPARPASSERGMGRTVEIGTSKEERERARRTRPGNGRPLIVSAARPEAEIKALSHLGRRRNAETFLDSIWSREATKLTERRFGDRLNYRTLPRAFWETQGELYFDYMHLESATAVSSSRRLFLFVRKKKLHQRGEGAGLRYCGREDFQLGLEEEEGGKPTRNWQGPLACHEAGGLLPMRSLDALEASRHLSMSRSSEKARGPRSMW
ncbi:uncharacterized protein BDZ83DRAFT_168067 [Colletotrichum acutatum]|uniref:Uncharacterized protein n=1 Tax=Glomerella acutata TaxID=27357 RepID=A0AAD8XHA0_GLOAC|nr:uncharacterized protein BDZ83DRAFT_168067 [Colletotrichum acutatum]KAK1727934.1 hypothetical protein BDZ83DRAFT_168067 [Colletotrichum acutatum]